MFWVKNYLPKKCLLWHIGSIMGFVLKYNGIAINREHIFMKALSESGFTTVRITFLITYSNTLHF